MTSEVDAGLPAATEAFVWIWLPGAFEPVVAGRIERDGRTHVFTYGRSYLERERAIPIFSPELELQRGTIPPVPPLDMAGCLRDGAPDAWGRRVIINRLTGLHGDAAQDVDFGELTFMLNSGSDRIGALDFQRSPDRYQLREQDNASLEELQDAAGHVERGEPIPAGLEKALFHGSSIGGARPKALIEDGDTKFIAKFSASNDIYAVVKSEYVAMRLAARVGLDVAPVVLTSANGKDILLVQRFDRAKAKGGWTRKAMVSALTMLGLTELQAHYATRRPCGRRRHVIGHDVKTVRCHDLSPDDLVGFRGVRHGMGVGIADRHQLAAEDRLVEGERGTGVAAKVQVGGGPDRHGRFLFLSGEGWSTAAQLTVCGSWAMARSDRLFRLLQAMRVMPAPITAARLADVTEVSLRSLYRDIDALRAAGARIEGERGYGYRLVEDYALPPQTFYRTEIEALVLGRAEVKHMGDPALAEAAVSVLAKVAATLPDDREQNLFHAISQVYRPEARYAVACDMSIVRDACWREEALAIRYADKGHLVSERTILPLCVMHTDRTLTVLAWCCLREGFRMFRADRIIELKLAGASFRPRRVTLLREHLAELTARSTELAAPT